MTRKIIDMTHALSSKIPTWNGDCGFTLHHFHDEIDGNFRFTVQELTMHAGAGTHLDAPAHCINGGRTIDEILIGELISPMVVIDFSETISENKIITMEEIKNWEKCHRLIETGMVIFFHTGWSRYFGEERRYRNGFVFPSVHEDAAVYLVERGVAGLGIDTLSPDLPNSGFPVHRHILGADKFLIENVANLHELPPYGATMIALPLKIAHGTEAPLRIIGVVDKKL